MYPSRPCQTEARGARLNRASQRRDPVWCKPIAVWIEEAIVNDPVAIKFRVIVNQIDNPDAFNDPVRVATVLAAHACNLEGVRLINHGVVEDQVSLRGLDERLLSLLPEQARRQLLGFQIAIDAVMV